MKPSLQRLRDRIESNASLSGEERETMLGLLADLEKETDSLGDHPDAEKIREAVTLADTATAGEAEASTAEKEDEESPLEALQNAILELEASHPKTANMLSRIGQVLANMGI